MLQEGPVGKRATTIVLAGILARVAHRLHLQRHAGHAEGLRPERRIRHHVGDLEVRNAMLVTDDGESGEPRGGARQRRAAATSPVHVSWETEDGRQSRNVYLPAGAVRSLGADNDQFLLQDIDAPAGSLFPVYFQYGTEPGEELPVPVLAGELPAYEPLIPDSAE